MTTSIYLVRHGQTAWNKEEVFRGRTDIPLDETGLREAELAAEYFRPVPLQAVYSSPLSRARQTAQKIAQFHALEAQPLDGIIDISFGRWEGQSLREVEEKDGVRYHQWRDEPHLVKLPGGETLEEVRARAMAALGRVIHQHPEQALVLISHRVINKVLICGILGLDNSHFWQITQDTAAINLIQYRKGNYVLSLLNETCHLKGIRTEKTGADF